MFKIGHSYDVHQLEAGDLLTLGGIQIKHHKSLVGHSDADVVIHAIAESIIGALGLGDLGTLFPDNDPQYKNIDSMILLKDVKQRMHNLGYQINNLDVTIYAEKPILKDYKKLMENKISQAINIQSHLINIKATRGEKIGPIGLEQGIGCESVVLLIKEKNEENN